MDIGPSSLANREIAINQANVGQEVLSKTLEKTEENKKVEETAKPEPQHNDNSQKQEGRIDTYA